MDFTGTDIEFFSIYATTSPSPTAGPTLYAVRRAGQVHFGWKTPAGSTERVGPWRGVQAVYEESAIIGATGTTLYGLSAPTITTNSTTANSLATTNYQTMQRRVTYATAAAVGGMVQRRHVPLCSRRSPGGGFRMVTRFAFPSIASSTQILIGLSATSGAFTAGTNPSAMLNTISFAKDTSDTSAFTLMSCTSSGSATKTALPNTGTMTNAATAWFQLELACIAGDATIGYRVTRTDASGVESIDEGVIASNLPVIDTIFTPQFYLNNTVATASSLSFGYFYLETD